MFPHWQYLLEDLFGPVSAVYARRATHLPRRWDEAGEPYDVTADDAAYAVLEFASGAVASVNSSWAVRVNRRELLELQVDGTHGSAVAGLRNCAVQHKVSTPMPVWNPDLPDPLDYPAMWTDVPDNMVVRQRLQDAVGAVPAGRRPRRAVRAGTCSPAPGASSSPSSRCAPPTRAAGSRSRRLKHGAGNTEPEPDVAARITLPGRAEPLEVTPPGLGGRLPAARVAPRLRRRPRRLDRQRRPHRLGGHPPVPRPPVGARLRGRRGDGHRAARHGPVLVAGPGADQQHGGTRGRPPRRGPLRGPRLRRGHRPPRRERQAHSLPAITDAYTAQLASSSRPAPR